MDLLRPVVLMSRALEDARPSFAAAGVQISLVPPPAASAVASIRIDADSSRALAQIVVRDTGELDLVIGDALTGTVLVDEHREITDGVGVEDVLRTLLFYLRVDSS